MKLLPLLLVILIVCALLPNEAFCDQSAVERSESLEEVSREIVKRSCKRVCSGTRRTKKCMQKCKSQPGR
uniref:La-kappaKTx5 n=1 Tax=Liocheles australasiae TaxID=431266 RepID=KKX55_LIOAU